MSVKRILGRNITYLYWEEFYLDSATFDKTIFRIQIKYDREADRPLKYLSIRGPQRGGFIRKYYSFQYDVNGLLKKSFFHYQKTEKMDMEDIQVTSDYKGGVLDTYEDGRGNYWVADWGVSCPYRHTQMLEAVIPIFKQMQSRVRVRTLTPSLHMKQLRMRNGF